MVHVSGTGRARDPRDRLTEPLREANTPNTDERFFSLSTRNPGGKAHIVFVASATNEAGCAIIGDRGTTPGNLERRIAYLAAPLAQSLLDAPARPIVRASAALRVSPNPALAYARVRIEAAPAEHTRLVEVLDLTGRRVATLVVARGERFAEWQGRDDAGRAAPAGVYFARVAGDEDVPAARFVMAR